MKLRRTPVVLTATGLAIAVCFTSLSSAVGTLGAAGTPAQGHFGGSSQDIAGDYWDPQAQNDPKPRSLVQRPWPSPASLVARLKHRGLNPILVPGYTAPVYEQNAFLDNSGTSVNAVMVHDTGTSVPASRLRNTHSLDWITYGVKNSRGNTVRACHLYVARNGDVYVVYALRTWHAGAGDSMFGIPANKMNGYSYGIEIESQGGGVRDLTAAQINSASRVAAALLEVADLPVTRAINHKDYAGRVQGKVDTAYPISFWRDKIAAIMGTGGSPTPTPTPTPAPTTPPTSNPNAISMSRTKPGLTNPHVGRYQRALRSWISVRGLPLARLNPSGPTAFFGSETQRMTRVTIGWLRKRYRAWRSVPLSSTPNRPLIKAIGRIPVD